MVPTLLDLRERGLPVKEVIWDRGYSQLIAAATAHPLHAAGIEQTFRPMERQRKLQPHSTDAILIEGQLFSASVPEELRRLKMPPLGADEEQLRAYEQRFNQRARFRWQRHARPDSDGVTRWKCPFHAGFLRSRDLPWTMSRSRQAPLVDLMGGDRCCDGTKSLSAENVALWQPITAGTTAWRVSYGRRQVAEGANAMLKGGFVNIERKFLRVLGRTKMMLLLAFTIAGHNRDRIRAFVARKTHEAMTPKRRAKRRKGTWRDILGERPAAAGRDPPPS
jgi:hypothetical protein